MTRMTREEAKNKLKELAVEISDYSPLGIMDAINVAIEALEEIEIGQKITEGLPPRGTFCYVWNEDIRPEYFYSKVRIFVGERDNKYWFTQGGNASNDVYFAHFEPITIWCYAPDWAKWMIKSHTNIYWYKEEPHDLELVYKEERPSWARVW